MSITFPRILPSYHLKKCLIGYIDNVVNSPSNGGLLINSSNVNDELWKIDIETGILYAEDRQIWSAWRKSLRGGLKFFIARDVTRNAPLYYPSAKVSTDIEAGWDGEATVTSLATGGVLGLSGLPASYQFKAGDRIGLEQSGHYGYYEILEDVTASSGGVASITVAPFLHTSVFTTGAVARVFRPVCQFVIDWTAWNEDGNVEPSTISFSAVQRL